MSLKNDIEQPPAADPAMNTSASTAGAAPAAAAAAATTSTPLQPPTQEPLAGSGADENFTQAVAYVGEAFAFAGENKMAFPDDIRDRKQLFKASFAEFTAMALFVYFGCGSVISTGEFLVNTNSLNQTTVSTDVARILPIATAFGIGITVLIFNIGHISGGHINPAVTFGLFLMQKVSPIRLLCYWIAQFAGSMFGAVCLWGSVWGLQNTLGATAGTPPFLLGANQLSPLITVGNGFFLEIMGTAYLMFTVLSTAIDQRSFASSNLLPFPIGFTVWIVHLVLIPSTGCGINPARTFGPAVVDAWAGNMGGWQSTCWIYYIGPFIGSLMTAIFMRLLWGGVNPPEPKAASIRKLRNKAKTS